VTCEGFDGRLDALLDGACTPEEWRDAAAHIETCARCRRVFEAMAGRGESLSAGDDAALTASILARTAGEACGSVRERLCNLLDGDLAPFDRELVEGHLDRCAPCRALAQALDRVELVLPAFVEMKPPASFVDGVLAGTSRRPASPTLAESVAPWLAKAAERPRFALEVAYACTLIMLLVLGDPVKAYREVSTAAQPRVAGVARAIDAPLTSARTVGADALSTVGRALRPVVDGVRPSPGKPSASWVAARWKDDVATPLGAFAGAAVRRARAALTAVDRLVRPRVTREKVQVSRCEWDAGPTRLSEPGPRVVRLS
jgi:anti-sigma factor RsiW